MQQPFPELQINEVDLEPSHSSQQLCDLGKSLKDAGKFEEANEKLVHAIQFDRGNTDAYEELIRLYESLNQTDSLNIIRGELGRLKGTQSADVADDSENQNAGRSLTDIGPKTTNPKRILVVTNLFPPQEMGGFGKTMWEFSHGLMKKGHQLKILTSDSPGLYHEPESGKPDIECFVDRCLQLFGSWKTGRAEVESDEAKLYSIAEQNHSKIRTEIEDFRPDLCLVGNIDLLGYSFLHEMVANGIPVVHRLGNKIPGYPVEHTPKSPLYCMAPCSDWLKQSLISEGYPIQRFEVLYPGSPLEQYYRYISPDFSFLRIAYASIVAPFKGLHVLIDALIALKHAKIRFECHVLGNATDAQYLEKILRRCSENGLHENVRFYGYQSRQNTARVFDRCNTLVFPSTFEEPFGKTQIEAMASGMTVVCSGTGGSREIVRNGKTGLTFRNKDGLDLAEKLAGLAQNRDAAFELAQAGQQRCFRFSSANSVIRLDSIIEKMVGISDPGI